MHPSTGEVYGSIEAGGTKFVCAVSGGPDDIRAEIRYPTTTPAETIGRAIDFFREQQQAQPLAAVGIGAFGPVDPNPLSPTFGYITTTPKPGWAMTDFAGAVSRALDLPVSLDTDVNAAALGEHLWGAARGLDTFLYLTIGTGIGGGAMVNGSLLHGLLHPEMGHVPVRHDLRLDPFPGCCPFHGDCFEGLAAGPAMEKRWGQRAETLPPDHPAWALEAGYIAQALAGYIFVLSPQRIIIGGGVSNNAALFDAVRAEVQTALNGYIQMPQILTGIDDYIVPPGLGNRSGMLGAVALAMRAARTNS